jgi:hypothetical protein
MDGSRKLPVARAAPRALGPEPLSPAGAGGPPPRGPRPGLCCAAVRDSGAARDSPGVHKTAQQHPSAASRTAAVRLVNPLGQAGEV